MKTLSIYIILCLLVLVGCKEKGTENSSTTAKGKAAKAEDTAPAVELPGQQQTKPDPDKFKGLDEKLEGRGSGNTLPASWPASLTLPQDSTITQSTERDGLTVVEFTNTLPLADVGSKFGVAASVSGFKLRQADVDKYTQSRIYTDDIRQLTASLTDMEGVCHGSLVLRDKAESQYFSEATHYTGEFSLPGSWPSDILPIYEGCVLRELYVPLTTGGRLMLNAQTNAAEQDVMSWLESELPGRGWTMGEATSRNGFSIRTYTGNGYTLTVSARGAGGLTDIQYEATGTP